MGDTGFVGVNMRLDPSQLPPGFASEAINMRFRNGVAETRKGFVKPPWMNKITAGSVYPWGTIDGIGEFKDPNTLANYLIISAEGTVYVTRQCNSQSTLTTPSGFASTGAVTFEQAFDTMVMFRGASTPPLSMASIESGFANIEQTLEGTSTDRIPNAERGLFFQNRLFIPNNNDELVVSDFGDYTRYLPVVNQLRVNQGSSDSIVNLAKFNDTTVLVFKENSIYAINNVYGSLSEVQQDLITDQFGLIAAESLVHCGRDMLFLSEMGVMSLQQTEQNKIQSVTMPLSEPIQPLIDRINWPYASGAVAAYWDNKYYLAVPLDSAEILGPELVEGSYPPGLPFNTEFTVAGLEVGSTYRLQLGANESQLTNGSLSLAYSGDFVAEATTAVLTGTDYQLEVTASLKKIHKGVNNAVLVYDFLNKAWAGYDEADQFSVKKLFTFEHNGIRRLFFTDHDGWVKMYEEDYEDHVSVPYVDVVVASAPSTGNTIRVNGGTTVTAIATASTNLNNTWGTNSIANAGTNLWADPAVRNSGYAQNVATNWTAPDTQVVPISGGVRFYSTNGVMPTVTTTGSWATVTYYNTQQIESTVTTRAYAPEAMDLGNYDWLSLDVQTWNPDYSVTALTDGVGEDTTVDSSITKSRTNYTVFGRAAFTQSNLNGDHDTAHREDYSVSIGTGTGSVAGVYFDGGLDLTRHQEFREEFKVKKRGRACRIKIVNSQGRIRLMGVKMENRRIQTQAGAKT